MSTKLAFAIVAGCFIAGMTPAQVAWSVEQKPATPDMPSPQTELLAASAFDDRVQTTLRWWSDRDQWRSDVIQATRHPDPEIADRARWVQSQWQRGILTDTPTKLVAVLTKVTPAEAIEVLLEAGRFGAATVAIEEASGTIEYEAILARVSLVVESRYPIYARIAILQDSLPDFIAFLNLASANKKMALCRDDLLRRPGDSPTLPASAKNWREDQRVEALCVMHLLRGNHDAAAEIAQQHDELTQQKSADTDETNSSRHSLNRVVRMVTSDWKAIAEESAQAAKRLEQAAQKGSPVSKLNARDEAIRHWSDTLIAATRSGNTSLRQAAIDALTQDSTESLSPSYETLRWRSLLIHGEVDTAIDILEKQSPREAASIAIKTSRHARGLQLLGFDAEQLDTHLEQWLDEAIGQQRSVPEKELTSGAEVSPQDKVLDCLALMRVAIDVGRNDIAYRIASQLSDSRLYVKASPGRESVLTRHFVLATLAATAKTDWIFELAAPEKPSLLSRLSLRLVSRVVDPTSEELLYYLNWFLFQHRPDWSTEQCFITACEIARADPKDVRRHRQWIDVLGEHLRSGESESDLQLRTKVDEYTLSESDVPSSEQWKLLFEAHGRPDLVRAIVRGQASNGDLQARLNLLTDRHRDGWHAPTPEDFESIWQELISEPQTVLNAGLRDDAMVGFEIVLQQFLFAQRDGDQPLADQLGAQLRVMAASPSTDMRQQMADALAGAGMWDLAEDLYQSLLLVTAFESDETLALMDIARSYNRFVLRRTTATSPDEGNAAEAELERLPSSAIEKRQQAIRWYDLGFAGTLAASDYQEINYVTLPQLILRNQLELILQSDQQQLTSDEQQEIKRLFELLLRLEPIDIHSAELMLPRIKQLGMTELADEWLRRIVDAGQQHVRQFPLDATAANNVAWCAVRNQSRLDDALGLSRQAVAIEPDSAVYRDTLAEILAQRGEITQALQLERTSLLDDPGQWHLHLQIDRFESMQQAE
ncbi:GlcNAc transferase [Rhodopirellula sp. P2]|uniref:GlcNAc transferase n=1 Tax=Rhodopirellula sp. P2 TaxID=2127060 RepID=UPI002367FB16|nr:GlcNAc transferase [Rhodopirellula sp. P2]WDQ18931.1 GlcNAc transferase [Rhodopirellula sp. P2]